MKNQNIYWTAMVVLVIVSIIGGIVVYQKTDLATAVGNWGATVGIVMATFSAKNAQKFYDQVWVVAGLVVTTFFFCWSLYLAVNA
ncbi:hypothetical protein [Vibrio vulnificus]|uniref:hypothetical protein n=1 Tax=Vibrio vulnificus TaxID=672 RepID=UPI00287A050E|nr:hypothetical protein [Vibrio vulnificus]EHZ2591097.1 hypothetical protein [Vibrio parahaemolyticus]MDS1869841.1 hypothetical protein [Vibrio vulnificus]